MYAEYQTSLKTLHTEFVHSWGIQLAGCRIREYENTKINNFFIWLFYEALCYTCCHFLNSILVTIYQKIIADTKYILTIMAKSQPAQCSGYSVHITICKEHILKTAGQTSQHLEQELAFRYAVTNEGAK